MKKLLIATVLAALAAVGVMAQDSRAIMALVGRNDASANLMVTAAASAGTTADSRTIGSLVGRVDANRNLMVALAGGTATPDKLCLDAANQDACIQRLATGKFQLGNAATSTDFNCLALGGSTASFPAIRRDSTQIDIVLASDCTTAAPISASSFMVNPSGTGLFRNTAPSAPSSCGSGPAVTNSNGTAVFTVTGGTGGATNGCVITMPASSNGWTCYVQNRTADAGHRADRKMVQIADTTTSVTVEYQVVSTGAATAWTASDVFKFVCVGY